MVNRKEVLDLVFTVAGLKIGDKPIARKTGIELNEIVHFDFNHKDRNNIAVKLEHDEDEMDLSLLLTKKEQITQKLKSFNLDCFTFQKNYFVIEQNRTYVDISYKDVINITTCDIITNKVIIDTQFTTTQITIEPFDLSVSIRR